VLAKLWEDARETILTGDVETFYTVPGQLEFSSIATPNCKKSGKRSSFGTRKRLQRAADAER